MKKIINFFNTNFGFLILITISVFLLYGKSLNYELLNLDDLQAINGNIEFISDYKNIPRLFLKDCYCENIHVYYRPFLTISFAIEAIFFKDNPKPYHFVNIILFILSFYLMFLLLQKLKFNTLISKFIILLFLVHPIFTSAAVWIAARNDSLLIVFVTLSLINIINYLNLNSIKYLSLTILFFIFSIFTKETGLMLIPIYIAVIYCFNLKISKKQIIYLLVPIFISVIIYFYLRSISVSKVPINVFLNELNFYLNNSIVGMLLYIYKIFIPENIAVISDKINYEYILFSFFVYSTLFYLFYKKIFNRKIVIFSIIWFILMLFPTFLITECHFFFHRILTAVLGIIIILISLIEIIIKKYPISKKYLLILFFVLFITYSFGAYKQADKYKNSEIFWQNAYLDCPKSSLVLAAIGKIYYKYGYIEKGYEYLKKALKDDTSLQKYSKDLAQIFVKTGNLDAAERISKYFRGYYVYYDIMSTIYNNKNDFETALIYAKKANEIKPYNQQMLSKLSRLYALNGNYELAKETLLKIKNKTADNYYVLAMLYEDLKDKQKAVEAIQKATELEPDNQQYIDLLKKLEG